MIVDAHHHLWQVGRGDYGWLDAGKAPALAPICRDYGVGDFAPLAAAAGVEASVVVQAAPTTAETHWLLARAAESKGLVRKVVGWVDMEAPDAAAQIERLAAHPLFAGIRPMLQDIPETGWMLGANLDAAYRALVRCGLSFDALVKPRHLPLLPRLAERYPGLNLVVDHAAKPDIAGGMWEPWANSIKILARETDAACKLSGLLTEAGPRREPERLQRYVDHLLECFGPQRLMWGSDWPVLELAGDYASWRCIAAGLLKGLDGTALDRVFGATAIERYRLVPPAG
jgi:L-fuconolactonase